MKIIIGSTSEQKIKYLAEVLEELEIKDCKILPYPAQSGVAAQPLSTEETLRGSRNRARTAYAENSGDFSIGIEVGYELNATKKYEIYCWATVYDGKDYYSRKSNSFLLPSFHQEKLRSGLNLGDYVREYLAGSDGVKKRLGNIIKDRNTIIKNAIAHTLLYFFNKEEYT